MYRIRHIVWVLLLASSTVTAEPSTPLKACYTANPNRIQVSQCLDQLLSQANADMARVIHVVRVQMQKLDAANGRTKALAMFDASQQAFENYRERDCAWAGVQMEPGTGSGDAVRDCQIRRTRARVAELEAQFAISGSDTTYTPTGLPAGLAGRTWRLTSMMQAGRKSDITPDTKVTIVFTEDGHVSGKAPINAYNGGFSLSAGMRIEWRKPGFNMTRMAGPPALMQVEDDYLQALARCTQLRFEDSGLLLENHDRSIVLTYSQ
jgi:heat shock protein HslJ